MEQMVHPIMMASSSLMFISLPPIQLIHQYVSGHGYLVSFFFFLLHGTDNVNFLFQLVNYHAHGLRINPNLYNCGKVCLSLLGTWSGTGVEQWRPCKSNMLQVLVSIQGLILNAEPFYNEPAYETTKNSIYCKEESRDYSETTFLLSLKTMLYTMRNPPKVYCCLNTFFSNFFLFGRITLLMLVAIM